MIEALAVVFLGLAIYSGISLILGLIKPVWVLWFLDRFNRLKVIQYYGLALVICLLLWFFGFLIVGFSKIKFCISTIFIQMA